jgi:DNA modification methylase
MHKRKLGIASMKYGLFVHDARLLLDLMPKNRRDGKPKEFVTLTVTSPPYFDQKDYGNDKQLGYGQEYSDYLKELKIIFSDIYRITKSDGSLWLILDMMRKNSQIVNLPFEITKQIEQVGWKLNDIIIWEKDKTLPWSRDGQLRKIFEYVLFFSKTNSFKYRLDRVRDPIELKEWWVKYPERYHPQGKAPANVWHYPIPVQGSWGQAYLKHFCPLPIPLIERIIDLSTDKGDVILDPFAGSGSVIATAEAMGRKGIGLDLNPEYIEFYNRRTRQDIKSEVKGSRKEKALRLKRQARLRRSIERLRRLKYAKTLVKMIAKRKKINLVKSGLLSIFVFPRAAEKSGSDAVELPTNYFMVFSKDVDVKLLQSEINHVISRPPLSKFGVIPKIVITSREQVPAKLANVDKLYLYPKGMFHSYSTKIGISKWLNKSANGHWRSLYLNGVPPILSNIAIKQPIVRTWRPTTITTDN